MSVAIKAYTGKAYDPNLQLSNECIPYLDNSTFHFLGAPVAIHSTGAETMDHLIARLSSMLQKVDEVPITHQQRLKVFKVAICPRLTWDLSISDLPISWLENHLQPVATSYLKRWSGLARSADPNRLFLPKANGGLELPHLVTTYKKIHAAKAGSYMYSGDSVVRAIATDNTLYEAQLHRSRFHPHHEVMGVMQDDPGASKKHVISRVKAKVNAMDTAASWLARTSGLQVQGLLCENFQDMWPRTGPRPSQASQSGTSSLP